MKYSVRFLLALLYDLESSGPSVVVQSDWEDSSIAGPHFSEKLFKLFSERYNDRMTIEEFVSILFASNYLDMNADAAESRIENKASKVLS